MKQKKILLVEDEALIALGEKKLLESQGFSVVIKHNAADAIKEGLGNFDIDLILMDIDLGPGHDGCHAAEEILKQRDIPLIFLSSHTESHIVKKTNGITSYGYIVKNAGETVLMASIEMALKLYESKKIAAADRDHLFTTLNSIGDAVITTDDQGIVTHINPIAETLTGWDTQSATGKSLDLVFHIVNSFSRARTRNPVEKVLSEGKIVGLANHTILISKDKTEYQIADSAAPIVDRNKNITGVVLVFRDVTREYKLLEALQNRESELRHQLKVEKLSNEISIAIANAEAQSMDEAINVSIQKLAEFAGANRSTLFSFSSDLINITNTHEWCQDPDDSQIALLQNIPFESFGWHRDQLLKKGQSIISRISDYPPEAEKELEWIEEHGHRSLLFITLYHRDKAVGALGFYGPSGEVIDWPSHFVDMLHTIGNVILNALERHKTEQKYIEVNQRNSVLLNQLKSSKENYERIINGLKRKHCLFSHNPDGVFKYLSKGFESLFGYSSDDFVGRNWRELNFTDESIDKGNEADEKSIRVKQESDTVTLKYHHPDNIIRYIEITQFFSQENDLIEGICVDTTDEVLRKSELKNTARQNKELLHELQHRVKNSFNLILSMIKMESDIAQNEEHNELLKKISSRISAISEMYTLLYETDSIVDVELSIYLNSVIISLPVFRHEIDTSGIQDIGSVTTRTAIPIGLIAVELITNAVKHAFKTNESGCIVISLDKDGSFAELQIRDNGIGIQKNESNSKSKGLQMIEALSGQLKGSFKMESKEGTSATLKFPLITSEKEK